MLCVGSLATLFDRGAIRPVAKIVAHLSMKLSQAKMASREDVVTSL
jgi:hypothetical protein